MERKAIAVILSLILIITCVPFQVFATEGVAYNEGVILGYASSDDAALASSDADATITTADTGAGDTSGSGQTESAQTTTGTIADSGNEQTASAAGQTGTEEQSAVSGEIVTEISDSSGIAGDTQGDIQTGTLDTGVINGNTFVTDTYTEDTGIINDYTYTTGTLSQDYTLSDGTGSGSSGYSGLITDTDTGYTDITADSDWAGQNNMIVTEDGYYEYTDDEGSVWDYNPDDPQLRRFFSGPDVEQIKYSYDPDRLFGGSNTDPYVYRFNPKYSYGYPLYYKNKNASELVDVHYGMDISYYQRNISVENWKKLKELGLEFAIIRAGYRGYGDSGTLNPDTSFAYNVQAAYKAGIAVGVYFYSQATTVEEGAAEAVYCMELANPYREMITLPIMIDYEYADTANGVGGRLKKAGLTKAEHTAVVNAFCSTVRRGGFLAGIYANKSMIQSDMILKDIAPENYIWMANFVGSGSDGLCTTNYSGRLNAWQYTSNFTGWGPSGLKLVGTDKLDMDFWYGDFPAASTSPDDNGGSAGIIETDDETEAWGDIIKEGNEEILKYFLDRDMGPSDIPEGMWVFGVEKEMDFTGKELTQPGLKVFYDNEQLTAGRQYTVKYSDNTKAGTAKFVVTGRTKPYSSSRVQGKFTINELDLSEGTIAPDISFSYRGRVRKGTTAVLYPVNGKYVALKEGRDFTFEYPHTDRNAADYDNHAFVGDKDYDTVYTVNIIGKGNFAGSASFREVILARNTDKVAVSKLKVASIATQNLSYNEDGRIVPASPGLLVRDGREVLDETEAGSDEDGYSVYHINNDTLGTGSVLITGTGKYYGTRQVNYRIAKRSLSRVSIYNLLELLPFTGEAVEQEDYALTFDDGTEDLIEGRDYTVSYTNNVKAGKNKASIIFTGKGLYSGVIKKKFSIE